MEGESIKKKQFERDFKLSCGVVGLVMDKTIADTLTTQAMHQAILRR